MAQTSNMMSSAQIPEVAVIVKVPNIAMKYPMTNGQVIRFTRDEDYYEAMKMLSRANVPTVEAGSFPAQPKPQHPPPPIMLTPNDSASQIGTSNEASTSHSQILGFPSLGRPTIQTFRPAMAPPAYVPSALDNAQSRSAANQSMLDQLQTGPTLGRQIGGPRSNISLSTATTLVNAKEHFGMQTTYGRHDVDAYLPTSRPPGISHPQADTKSAQQQSNTTRLDPHESSLGLPPRRTLPFRKPEPSLSTSVSTSGSRSIRPPKQAQTDSMTVPSVAAEDHPSTAAAGASLQTTGKRKRGPAKTTGKPSAPRKPRAPNKRAKAGSKSTANARPVPTVEELLKQPSPSPSLTRRMTRAMSILSTQHDHDQQPNPIEAEPAEPKQPSPRPEANNEGHREASPSLGSPTRRITRSTSKLSTGVEHMKIPEPDADADFQPQHGKDNPYPCTPAEQMINLLTPASPEAQHVAAANLNLQPSAARNNPNQPAEPITVPPSSFACADPQPKSRPNQHRPQPEPSITDPDPVQAITSSVLTNLDADAVPDLASNDLDKLQAWSRQPPAVRLPTLKSYFCRLIMQPEFLNLCKDLEGMWEGEILNARLARMS
nr:hypothetical protein LTR18_005638 [Exophiala xenobiotica]